MKRVRAICVATLPDGRRITGREAQRILTASMDDIETPTGERPTFSYLVKDEWSNRPEDEAADGETFLIPPRE